MKETARHPDIERRSRAALSRLMEPQDAAGLALVQVAGAVDALRIATGQLSAGPELEQEITALLSGDGSTTGWAGMAASLKRWQPRIPDLAPERDLATMARLGGRLIIPSDECGQASWLTSESRSRSASGGGDRNSNCPERQDP